MVDVVEYWKLVGRLSLSWKNEAGDKKRGQGKGHVIAH
jgi:hypothetical protein